MSKRSLPTAPFVVRNPRVTSATPQSSGVPVSRAITAGAGLTGGGDLSADRTINVAANADGSIVVNANDVQVGVLASDAQHGARGGGTQHAAATTSVAGFLSAADKTKLDGIAASAAALSASTPADVGTTGAVGVGTTAARADHVHDLAFATLNTVLGQANAALGVNNQRIGSVADPSSAQDAATKAYVDSAVGGVAAGIAVSSRTQSGTGPIVTNFAAWSGLLLVSGWSGVFSLLGMAPPTGSGDYVRFLINTTTGDLVLSNLAPSASAGWRIDIQTSVDNASDPNEGWLFAYDTAADSGNGAWRAISFLGNA